MAAAAGKVAAGIGRAATGSAKAAGRAAKAAPKAAATAAAAGVGATADAGARTLRTPGRIVRARTRSASQVFWTAVVTLLALSLLALVLRAASTNPGRLNGAINFLPDLLRRFVNPFPPVQGPPVPPGLLPSPSSIEDAPEPESVQVAAPPPRATPNPHVLNVNVVNHSNRKVTVA